ncbi:hypothetical protein TI39_contig4132g00015 [Zymoseptoria brevis]|uniref:Uncharacterized protein n=1 Tax=Zymoseptoria brevis TaxID=1047168 RepID=A0A0F4GCL0_9PEZI|nr:hypothetical protein TI39_contig4132g00015 [Zymoseptoria brevis]
MKTTFILSALFAATALADFHGVQLPHATATPTAPASATRSLAARRIRKNTATTANYRNGAAALFKAPALSASVSSATSSDPSRTRARESGLPYGGISWCIYGCGGTEKIAGNGDCNQVTDPYMSRSVSERRWRTDPSATARWSSRACLFLTLSFDARTAVRETAKTTPTAKASATKILRIVEPARKTTASIQTRNNTALHVCSAVSIDRKDSDSFFQAQKIPELCVCIYPPSTHGPLADSCRRGALGTDAFCVFGCGGFGLPGNAGCNSEGDPCLKA